MAGNRDKLTIGMKLARERFADGDFEGTIARYTEAIDRRLADKRILGTVDKNRLALAYASRGFAKNELGRYEEAIADCDEAIRLGPTSKDVLTSAYSNRGLAKNKLGRFEEALEDLDGAIDLNPDNKEILTSAYASRGFAKNELGHHDEAIADCTKAIDLNPEDKGILASAYNSRGNAKYGLGDFNGALKDFTEALKSSPENPEARKNINAIETQKTLLDRAKERVDETVKAEEFKEQSDEYKRREEEHRKSARCEMGSLEKVIYGLIAGLISLIALSVYLDILKIADVVSNPFGLLPWITLIIIITSPRVWKIRLLIADANKAELMRAEYEHLFIVERRMLVYFAKDDTNEGRKIRSDYIQTTMTNSPSDKLLALQNKASVPSPNPAQNVVETIRSKVHGNPPS